MAKQSTPKTSNGDGTPAVSGFQEGTAYPTMPQTKTQFKKLLDNPSKPAQNQSAPSMEQLNPHLYPERLP